MNIALQCAKIRDIPYQTRVDEFGSILSLNVNGPKFQRSHNIIIIFISYIAQRIHIHNICALYNGYIQLCVDKLSLLMVPVF